MPAIPRSLIGERFGRLTVVAFAGYVQKGRRPAWTCLCDCGNEKVVETSVMKRGTTVSCGCWRIESGSRNRTHGESGPATKEYHSWQAMRQRCRNPEATGYERYGGRGITICERWDSFKTFLEDMGRAPSAEHSLDRIDPDGNYEPGNCRWATYAEQRANRSLKAVS